MAICKQKLSGDIDNRCALNQLCKKEEIIPERAQAKETVNRYSMIDKLVKATVKQGKPIGRYMLTKKLDDILIHPLYGYIVFLSVLFLIFQVVFSWSAYPMELIDGLFVDIQMFTSDVLPKGLLNDFKGILKGLKK